MNIEDALFELENVKKQYKILLNDYVELDKRYKQTLQQHAKKTEDLRTSMKHMESTIAVLKRHGSRKLTLRERIFGRQKLPGGMSGNI